MGYRAIAWAACLSITTVLGDVTYRVRRNDSSTLIESDLDTPGFFPVASEDNNNPFMWSNLTAGETISISCEAPWGASNLTRSLELVSVDYATENVVSRQLLATSIHTDDWDWIVKKGSPQNASAFYFVLSEDIVPGTSGNQLASSYFNISGADAVNHAAGGLSPGVIAILMFLVVLALAQCFGKYRERKAEMKMRRKFDRARADEAAKAKAGRYSRYSTIEQFDAFMN